MSDFWPLYGLRVRTPTLELRHPSPADVEALAAVAARGVHDPSFMPFTFPWTDVSDAERGRSVLQWSWRQLGALTPDSWVLPFVVVVDGVVVGTQNLEAESFPKLRETETGSWLGREFQGRGIGTEMRSAVVQFAFDVLGAEHVTSSAYPDNHASLAVSRKVGYVEDGIKRALRRDEPATLIRLRLPRAAWEPRRRTDIEISGVEQCLPFLGLAG